MRLNKEVIWEQVFPEDAELRIQQAFEMLLGEEFGLTKTNDYMSKKKYPKSINPKTIKAVIPSRRPIKCHALYKGKGSG